MQYLSNEDNAEHVGLGVVDDWATARRTAASVCVTMCGFTLTSEYSWRQLLSQGEEYR